MDTPSGSESGSKEPPPGGSPYGEPPWFAAEAYRGNTWTDWLRYHAFSIAVAVVVIAFGALLYFAPTPGGGSYAPAEVPSSAESAPAESQGQLGSGTAMLSVRSEPSGAVVQVDGDSIGTTPLEAYRITSGVYIVNVQRPGYFDRDTILVLRNDQSITYEAQLTPSGRSPEQGTAQQPSPEVRGPDVPQREQAANRAPPTPQQAAPPESDAAESEERTAESETPATGQLVVQSEPAEASVQIDGESVGATPVTLSEIEAGPHQIRIEREGYDAIQREVRVRAGAEERVSVTLNPRPGRLRVLVRPWGSIYVDGTLQVRDTDVWYETELAPGSYEVSAAHPALGETQRTVEVTPGSTREVVFDLRDN